MPEAGFQSDVGRIERVLLKHVPLSLRMMTPELIFRIVPS